MAKVGVIFLCLLGALFANVWAFEAKRADKCTNELCQLPNCRCSGMAQLSSEFKGQEAEIPQFVTVTFDDAVTAINYAQYQQLFKGLTNPDHCSVSGTFYVSHEYTDYSKVNALYTEGHEIALHSVTHGMGSEYWREADVDLIAQEFGDLIDMMEKYAKVSRKSIKGMRLPYLQFSGNNSFLAAQQLGLLYDASWPTLKFKNPAMWPYTLDYSSQQDCQIGPCPEVSIPGFWIYPMVSWTDKEGYGCSMIDGCAYQPEDKVDAIFEWILDNFQRHYEGNRAPFGMYLHSAWLSRGNNQLKAFRKFLKHVNSLPDVYITNTARVLQYVRNPILGKPFKGCLKKPKASCKPVTCPLKKISAANELRYMTVCDQCPEVYPWLGNPMGVNMIQNKH